MFLISGARPFMCGGGVGCVGRDRSKKPTTRPPTVSTFSPARLGCSRPSTSSKTCRVPRRNRSRRISVLATCTLVALLYVLADWKRLGEDTNIPMDPSPLVHEDWSRETDPEVRHIYMKPSWTNTEGYRSLSAFTANGESSDRNLELPMR